MISFLRPMVPSLLLSFSKSIVTEFRGTSFFSAFFGVHFILPRGLLLKGRKKAEFCGLVGGARPLGRAAGRAAGAAAGTPQPSRPRRASGSEPGKRAGEVVLRKRASARGHGADGGDRRVGGPARRGVRAEGPTPAGRCRGIGDLGFGGTEALRRGIGGGRDKGRPAGVPPKNRRKRSISAGS